MMRAFLAIGTLLAFAAADVALAQSGDPADAPYPSTYASSDGAAPADQAPAPKKKKSRRRRSAAQDEGAASVPVWGETDSARIKTVYDEQGNIIYQKAWDKSTGREVPVPDGYAPTYKPRESARDLDISQPTETRPYGRLRRPNDGEYEEEGYDPRPRYREHVAHEYPRRPPSHAYDFSLDLAFWSDLLGGTVSGASGTGSGTVASDRRQTYELDIMNPRAGFELFQLKHTAGITSAFSFRGVAFATGLLSLNFSFYDSYFRFPLYSDRDMFFDWTLGLEAVSAQATVTGGASTAAINTIVPLPTLGIMGRYALADNVNLRGFARGFSVSLGKNSATTVNAEMEAVYTFPGDNEYSRFNQLSAGFKTLLLNVTTDNGLATQGNANLHTIGPFVKFSAYF